MRFSTESNPYHNLPYGAYSPSYVAHEGRVFQYAGFSAGKIMYRPVMDHSAGMLLVGEDTKVLPLYREPDVPENAIFLFLEDIHEASLSVAIDRLNIKDRTAILATTNHEFVRKLSELRVEMKREETKEDRANPLKYQDVCAGVDLFVPANDQLTDKPYPFGLARAVQCHRLGVYTRIITSGYHHDADLEPYCQIQRAAGLPEFIDSINKEDPQAYARAISSLIDYWEDYRIEAGIQDPTITIH